MSEFNVSNKDLNPDTSRWEKGFEKSKKSPAPHNVKQSEMGKTILNQTKSDNSTEAFDKNLKDKKIEELKLNNFKSEQPKTEENKAEETKVKDSKTEETVIQGVKVENPKNEQPTNNTFNASEFKNSYYREYPKYEFNQKNEFINQSTPKDFKTDYKTNKEDFNKEETYQEEKTEENKPTENMFSAAFASFTAACSATASKAANFCSEQYVFVNAKFAEQMEKHPTLKYVYQATNQFVNDNSVVLGHVGTCAGTAIAVNSAINLGRRKAKRPLIESGKMLAGVGVVVFSASSAAPQTLSQSAFRTAALVLGTCIGIFKAATPPPSVFFPKKQPQTIIIKY